MAEEQFKLSLLRALARLGFRRARPRIPSRTLRRALNILVVNVRLARLQIPHYWAVYVHDGRGPIRKDAPKVLVWFRKPKDDPRLRVGINPVRARQKRHLTRAEFRFWNKRNRAARREGRPEPMIVRREVGPSLPTRFFDNRFGMRGFTAEANAEGSRRFSELVTGRLRRAGALRERDTIRVPFG